MRTCVAVLIAVVSLTVNAQDSAELIERIDSIAHHTIKSKAAPGVQVLIMRNGSAIHHGTYGYHTYDSVRQVRRSDIYDLASITKVAAATLSLMKLTSDGLFDPDKTLGSYLPEFERSDKGGMVWREILAHQAMLKPWIPYWESTVRKNGKYKRSAWRDKASRKYPTEVTADLYLRSNYKRKIYKAIKKSPLNSEPGYTYSGLAFYLIPELVERLSGKPYDIYLKEEIYSPIGIDTMGFNPLMRFAPDVIVPTEKDTFFRQVQIHGRVHDEGAAMMGGISGNAGLFSTAQDLAVLAQLLLDKGVHDGDTIIRPDVVEDYTRCQYCDTGNHRGMGFDKPIFVVDPEATSVSVSPLAGSGSYGHSGYTGTLLWIDPDRQMVFIFLSNRVYQTRLNRKLYTENIRPAMMEAIYRWMEEN